MFSLEPVPLLVPLGSLPDVGWWLVYTFVPVVQQMADRVPAAALMLPQLTASLYVYLVVDAALLAIPTYGV